MKNIKLENITDRLFEEAWQLYEASFPLEERRPKDAQARVMKNPDYNFVVVVDEDELIGFILWWDFESLRFIEYFATAENQRNKGIGASLLRAFMTKNEKPILLEVELPTSEINRRRIRFYERLGFRLNKHYYEIPPTLDGTPPIQLLIMTYPDIISENDVAGFVENYQAAISN